jgi:hypothetical protein
LSFVFKIYSWLIDPARPAYPYFKGDLEMNETLTMANANRSPAAIRALGGVLTFLGVILIGGMGTLLLWMNNIMNNNSSTTKWNGSEDQKTMVFLVLGSVMAFGFSALITGLWQIMTGKRNMKLIRVTLGLSGVLLFLSWWIRMVF